MAVRWNWKDKMGKFTMKNVNPLTKETTKYKVNIYQGNCLAVFIYEFKDKDTGKDMYNFYGFLSDKRHAENIKKDRGSVMGPNCLSTELNLYYPDSKILLNLLVKDGLKVKCYYKEPKKKKSNS